LLAAFDKRCNFYSDDRVSRGIVSSSIKLLERVVGGVGLDPIEWTPALFHKWNSQFKPAKQAKHMKVFPMVSECTSKAFTQKEIFVKVEALCKRHDENWAPRIIYQSSDIHNVLLGPVMQACTQRMFRCLGLCDTADSVNYKGAYKADSQELADYITRFSTPESIFVESDFSSNDMTQVRDVHLLEVRWLRSLGAPLWLTSLMLHANSFVVTSRRYGVFAKVTNQLPTGAQSTTFRNSMWNMTINFAFCTLHGFRGDVLVLGDDMLMRLDNPWRSRLRCVRRAYEDVCIRARMRADVSVRAHLSECSFLSKNFIMTERGYVMVPKFGKAVARFNARASSNEAVSDRAYLAGKALSYSYEFRHCPPISRCYYERFLQLRGDVVSLDGLGWNAKGVFLDLGVDGVISRILSVSTVCSRSDMTRFYHWKYGMTSTDIITLLLASVFGEDDLDEVTAGRIVEDFL
jgi:hypothetical protein